MHCSAMSHNVIQQIREIIATLLNWMAYSPARVLVCFYLMGAQLTWLCLKRSCVYTSESLRSMLGTKNIIAGSGALRFLIIQCMVGGELCNLSPITGLL